MGSFSLLADGGKGLGTLHVLHLHLGQAPCAAMNCGNGLDEGEVLGIQLQRFLVGLDGPLGTPATEHGLRFARELLDAQTLDRIHLGLAPVAGDLAAGPPVEAQGLGSNALLGGRLPHGIGHHAKGLQLRCDAGGQSLVVVLEGQRVGALEGLDLLRPVAALVGDLGQEQPGLAAEVVLERGVQAAAHGVARAAAGELPGDGGEQPQALVGAVGVHQVAQRPLAEGQGFLRQLGHFAQGFQGPLWVAAAQLDLCLLYTSDAADE